MEKIDLVIRYLDLANQYSDMLCSNEPVDVVKSEELKSEIYFLRDQLGLERIELKYGK